MRSDARLSHTDAHGDCRNKANRFFVISCIRQNAANRDAFLNRAGYISAMQPCKPHLIAEVELDVVTEALRAWRWLLGTEGSPLLVSAASDVFLNNSAARIC